MVAAGKSAAVNDSSSQNIHVQIRLAQLAHFHSDKGKHQHLKGGRCTFKNTRNISSHLITVASLRDIEKFLKGYGRIRNISVKEGFGFAEFDDRRDADDAVKVVTLQISSSDQNYIIFCQHQNTSHSTARSFCRTWTGRTLTGGGSELSTLVVTAGMMAIAMVAAGAVAVEG